MFWGVEGALEISSSSQWIAQLRPILCWSRGIKWEPQKTTMAVRRLSRPSYSGSHQPLILLLRIILILKIKIMKLRYLSAMSMRVWRSRGMDWVRSTVALTARTPAKRLARSVNTIVQWAARRARMSREETQVWCSKAAFIIHFIKMLKIYWRRGRYYPARIQGRNKRIFMRSWARMAISRLLITRLTSIRFTQPTECFRRSRVRGRDQGSLHHWVNPGGSPTYRNWRLPLSAANTICRCPQVIAPITRASCTKSRMIWPETSRFTLWKKPAKAQPWVTKPLRTHRPRALSRDFILYRPNRRLCRNKRRSSKRSSCKHTSNLQTPMLNLPLKWLKDSKESSCRKKLWIGAKS